jgi:hypothetical protein
MGLLTSRSIRCTDSRWIDRGSPSTWLDPRGCAARAKTKQHDSWRKRGGGSVDDWCESTSGDTTGSGPYGDATAPTATHKPAYEISGSPKPPRTPTRFTPQFQTSRHFRAQIQTSRRPNGRPPCATFRYLTLSYAILRYLSLSYAIWPLSYVFLLFLTVGVGVACVDGVRVPNTN